MQYPDFDPQVVVRDLWLTYRGASEPAIAGVSFTAGAGESVAFVGSTGAGKSTLADLLLGIVNPDRGSALIGGIDPHSAIRRWSGGIAYVPQEVALVSGTVRQNVALGLQEKSVDDDLAWEALERAHLADFLRESRDGLDTFIGENGMRLSGGQRQRLGIARALYTRPRLLVLDEATSALDAETEEAISQTMRDLEGSVTTITIAHRLATIRHCDLVIFLDHGHVAAQGTFEQVRVEAPTFDHQARLLGL
jgi:ABC-type multidrug transport system fused ATPase/permease subunit